MKLMLTRDTGEVLFRRDNIKGVLSFDAAVDGARDAHRDERRRDAEREAVERGSYATAYVVEVRDGQGWARFATTRSQQAAQMAFDNLTNSGLDARIR